MSDKKQTEKQTIASNAILIKLLDDNVKHFWNFIKSNWIKNLELYSKMAVGDISVIPFLQKALGKMAEFVDVEFTFGVKNRQELQPYFGNIELYISPKGKKENMGYVDILYDGRIKLNKLFIAKYKAFHIKDELIKEICYTDFTIKYEDFGVHAAVGLNEEKQYIINLIIVVKKRISDRILEKKNITFRSDDGKSSSRDVYIPVDNVVNMFLHNVIGEYNLLKHVGYLEILPEDDELLKDAPEMFTELADARKFIETIMSRYSYKECNYCSMNEVQVKLSACSRCKKINYCNNICQRSDWDCHKMICSESD